VARALDGDDHDNDDDDAPGRAAPGWVDDDVRGVLDAYRVRIGERMAVGK
jgi:hypothetical protein